MKARSTMMVALWHRQHGAVRFCLLFAVFFVVLYWLLMRVHGGDATWTIEYLVTHSEIWVCAQILAVFGIAAETEGTVVRTAHFGVRVLSGCNGMETVLLYSAAVLAYPVSLRAKGIALLVGIPAIQLVNIARILGLLMIGQYWPTWFHDAHVYWAQGLMICLVAAVWFWWIDRYGYTLTS
jgi:exosortase H (IPTLxxWG-CTERM-specific)